MILPNERTVLVIITMQVESFACQFRGFFEVSRLVSQFTKKA
jgi:hypothetical protein